MSSLLTALSISGLLVFGTTTSLFAKIGEMQLLGQILLHQAAASQAGCWRCLQSCPKSAHALHVIVGLDFLRCHHAVYELRGPGKDGKEEYFTKPWAMTTVMFLGMTLCLPLAYWEDLKKAAARRRTCQQAEKDSTEPLLSNGNGYHVRHPAFFGDRVHASSHTDTLQPGVPDL